VKLPPEYQLKAGSALDQALLVKFMQRTYRELSPGGNFAHLAETVDLYFSRETPLWWVERQGVLDPIACLWMGVAVDQVWGDRHAHIFLLYVVPTERRQGIGSALMQFVEAWARERGDRQISLQVFTSNQAALELYRTLGYQTQSHWMVKPLK